MKNDYYLRTEGERVFMCCGKAKCPSVRVDESSNKVFIEDDFNNTSEMSIAEGMLLSEAVQQAIKNSSEKKG
jgi:hypothetical protein